MILEGFSSLSDPVGTCSGGTPLDASLGELWGLAAPFPCLEWPQEPSGSFQGDPGGTDRAVSPREVTWQPQDSIRSRGLGFIARNLVTNRLSHKQ